MEHLYRRLGADKALLYAWFEAMHTRIDVLLWQYEASKDFLLQMVEAVRAEVERIESWGSCFRPDSEVSSLNVGEVGCWQNVSSELCQVLSDCIGYSESTGGLFDITASSVCWGVPISSKIEVNAERQVVRRLSESAFVNLSGYLKGYALKCSMAIIRAGGIRNALVNFGNSSVYALGNHPCGDGWAVSAGAIPGVVYTLKDCCLTTSGNASETRKHIVNPLTGELVGGKKEVSVVTDSPEAGEVNSIVRFLQEYSQ